MNQSTHETGIHSIDTSLMGELIAQAPSSTTTLHEALNNQLGIKNFPCWYPSFKFNGETMGEHIHVFYPSKDES